MRPLFSQRSSRILAGVVAASLIFTLLQSGPLHGTIAALVVTVILQVYLPGYLLARRLGKLDIQHPILRFAWVLVCGLSLTIVIGGAARLFNVPVMTYLIVLHALMLVLAALPAGHTQHEPWRFSRAMLPLYGLVIVCCVIAVGIGYASRYRFYGFEDQVIFVSHASWLVNNPGETPENRPLRSRQVGGLEWRDTRFDSDGWTYSHAAWAWASGISATQLIWFELDPLFVWSVPLLTFALAYELTRRETAAVWSAAALTLVGMLTLDNIAHFPDYTSFGRMTLVQISTLRQASLTIMLPLTLMTGFTAMRTWQRRDLFMVGMAGLALAIMHPIQITLFVIAIGVTGVLMWLSQPDRKTLLRLLSLALVIALLLALPFIQRLNRSGLNAADTIVRETTIEAADTATARGDFLLLPDFPLTGDTFIRNPATVFYHPLIVLGVAAGLLWGLGWRRSLAAQYIFGTTALTMILFFTPGVTEFYNRFVSSVGLLTTTFLLPLPLALGLSLDVLLRRTNRRILSPVVAVALVIIMGLLLFEPLPIRASTRDQIITFNQMQESRRLRPAHTALVDTLSGLLDPQRTSILMAPADSTSLIIEDLPRTLVTGGRGSLNRARDGDNRFFNLTEPVSPWLDSADLEYMAQWGVTHIVQRPDSTRLAQLMLETERFTPLAMSPGYAILELTGDTQASDISDLYAGMNALYIEMVQPRWGLEGFELVRPGDPAAWEPFVERWRSLRDEHPQDDRITLGLAYSYLMMGADELALPLWQDLHERHADVPLFMLALASTHDILGDPAQGAAVLRAALASDVPEVRVLAARTLLTHVFFYLLDDAELDAVLHVTETDAVVWDILADFDKPDAIRQRAALMMNAKRWQTAADWLDRIPQMEVSPGDITTQAAIRLVQGDIEGALQRLQPATDEGWLAAKVFLHPDRWQSNQAAQMYALLSGDIAAREGDTAAATAAYQQAIDYGAAISGRYFLTQLQQTSDAQITATDWPDSVIAPVSLLALADYGALYAMHPQVTPDEASNTLTVEAIYGSTRPYGRDSYPIAFWRIEVVSPDSSTLYAEADIPAQFIEESPVRAAATLDLPDDLDPLTPALVVITPGYSNRVTSEPVITPVTLNRPPSATVPAQAETVGLQFGDVISLESYTLSAGDDALDLTLFWQAAAPPAEDYQVFVHVVDTEGTIIAQADSAPVQNRYPTNQWRVDTLIEDAYQLPVANLPEGFGVRVGLYRLTDSTRLPISPADERVQDNSVLLYEE